MHDGCGAVDVDDKAWKVVAFAVHETVGVVVVVDDAYAASHVEGYGKSVFVEGLVDGFVGEGEDSDHDASYLEMSCGYVFVFVGEDFDYFAFFGFVAHALYGA